MFSLFATVMCLSRLFGTAFLLSSEGKVLGSCWSSNQRLMNCTNTRFWGNVPFVFVVFKIQLSYIRCYSREPVELHQILKTLFSCCLCLWNCVVFLKNSERICVLSGKPSRKYDGNKFEFFFVWCLVLLMHVDIACWYLW